MAWMDRAPSARPTTMAPIPIGPQPRTATRPGLDPARRNGWPEVPNRSSSIVASSSAISLETGNQHWARTATQSAYPPSAVNPYNASLSQTHIRGSRVAGRAVTAVVDEIYNAPLALKTRVDP
jgi:hypothetical protein